MPDVQAIVKSEIKETLQAAGASPDVTLSPKEATKLQNEIAKKIDPVLENAMNKEPWYKSWVTISAIGGILLWTYGVGWDAWQCSCAPAPGDLTIKVGELMALLSVLYGRHVNAKPIGG